MRVRVAYTMDVSDDYRRAIRAYYGRTGLASRDEIKAWAEQYGASMDDDLMSVYLQQADDDDKRRQG